MIRLSVILFFLGSCVSSYEMYAGPPWTSYVVGKGGGDFLLIQEFDKPTSVARYSVQFEIYNKTLPEQLISTRTRLLGSNDCMSWTELCDYKPGTPLGIEVTALNTALLVVRPNPECRRSFFCYGLSVHFHKDSIAKPIAVSNVKIEPGPMECCDDPVYCPEYRGHVHRTKSGVECQEWSKDEPQEKSNPLKSAYNDIIRQMFYGLEANYCRTPTSLKTPWCYTMGLNAGRSATFPSARNLEGHIPRFLESRGPYRRDTALLSLI